MPGNLELIKPYLARFAPALSCVMGPLLRLVSHDVRERLRGRPSSGKPSTLNLMVNDICNSRCVMCNVWRRKREREFKPEELARVLEDPLFDGLRHVGVSGGEPTLRKDLPEIFRVIVQKKGLKGVSLITNAIRAESVIEAVERCQEICSAAHVSFHAMVSLDGIGPLHDRIRGVEGNFENAVRVIRHLRDNTSIQHSVACTVVKDNVWRLDEVLDFCKEERVQGRFRIAEFINRLYNEDRTDVIRNFDDDEKYQIALFFFKLERLYEKSPAVRETYRNIRGMVFEGKPRLSGCPFREDAVGLDSAGNLIYCSPKSPVLGSCLKSSAESLYRDNLGIRAHIIENYCRSCVHDYHAPPVRESLKEELEEALFVTRFSVKKSLRRAFRMPSAKPGMAEPGRFSAPFITGWYGTETAGDKAILSEIAARLKEEDPSSRITVASLYPFVTRRTLREIGLEDARVVKTYSPQYLYAVRGADAVIMGGGPLMGMEPLGFVLQTFALARELGIPTLVEGCGIGPLSSGEHIRAVKEILRLSTSIKVRDGASLEWVLNNTQRKDAIVSGDPALGFVERWRKGAAPKTNAKNQHLACFLREITDEYACGLKPGAFGDFRKRFEDELGRMVRHIAEKTGLKPVLMPMHTFIIGGDDRDFARRFARQYLKDIPHELGDRVYTPQDILTVMSGSRLNLCMRFHSVLFAEALGAPYLAIDYTGGGKIKGFLHDRRKDEIRIDRADIAEGRWKEAIDAVLAKAVMSKA